MIKMNEEIEFKKVCKETLDNIYSKLDGEEKQFLSYLVNCFNITCEKREQLQNNWNELKKWLEECLNGIKQNDVYDRTSYEQGQIIELESSIAKVQELEQGKDEN